jgi:hypothetical protein
MPFITPIKTYYAEQARLMYRIAKYVTKHQATMLAVCAALDPADLAAVSAAFVALQAYAVLFEHVHSIVDPNAPPDE